jgi:type I restriction enzyme S subunit
MQDLSTPWKTVQLQEVAEVVSGYGFPKKHQGESSGELPFFKVGDISREVQEGKKFIQTAENYVSHSIAEEISAKPVPSGAIVFAKIGEAVKLNRRGVTSQECLIDNNVMALIPKEDGINGDYLYYFMQSFDLGKLCRATTVPSVRKSDVVEIELPLPPLPEQRRIVAKIEELFSNLDAGRAGLQTVQRQLERYRLSVLQAAVEGRLTAAWRRTHAPEPADALLDRILDERQKQWEEHYRWSRYDSKGKEPPSGWKSRYKEREAPKLPDSTLQIPESWTWISADQIGRVETGSTPKTSVDDYYGGGHPFYRPGDLETGINTRTAERTLTDEGLAEARPLPKGSTLITCIGATIGKTGLINTKGASNQQINAIIPAPSVVPEYVFYVARSPFFQTLIKTRASATTMPILNKGRTKSLPIPLPPAAEQKQIVAEVERLLSVADDAAQTAEREHTRAERLRQSILKQAFSGQLVPHEGATASAPAPSGNGAQRPGEQIELEL